MSLSFTTHAAVCSDVNIDSSLMNAGRQQAAQKVDSSEAWRNHYIRPYKIYFTAGLISSLLLAAVFWPGAILVGLATCTFAVLYKKKKRQLKKMGFTTAPSRIEVWQAIGWSFLFLAAAAVIVALLLIGLSH
jgi:hypothetical protein